MKTINVQIQMFDKIQEKKIPIDDFNFNKTAIEKIVQNIVETMTEGKWSNLTWQCENFDGWAVNNHSKF